MTRADLLIEVAAEVERARKLFPDPTLLTMALAEEAGEVTKAVLDMRQGKATRHDLRKEIRQTMAMCIRLAEEGDPAAGLLPVIDCAPAPSGETGTDALDLCWCGHPRGSHPDG